MSKHELFTNGVLGYTGQTWPFPKCCGDVRSPTASSSRSPRRRGPYPHVQRQDRGPPMGISPTAPSAPGGGNGLVFSATPKLRVHK